MARTSDVDEAIAPLYRLVGGKRNIRTISDFFIIFSRFEYALKEAGYVFTQGPGYAAPNWTAFKDEIRPLYDARPFTQAEADSPLRLAADFLIANPPQRQVLRGLVQENSAPPLGWDPLLQQGDGPCAWLIKIVQLVRNNLFHGGKSLGREEIQRDLRLVSSSTIVLVAFLQLIPEKSTSYRLTELRHIFRET